MNEEVKNSWNQESDEYFKSYETDVELHKLELNPTHAFPREVLSMINADFPDLRGKSVCVAASGDNYAAFGFHLLGAKVTSVDLSERQIYNAKKIAKQKNWEIEFICEDNMDFKQINSNTYDLVYTSNGCHVWISDLSKMYSNFHRVLHDNGKYIMFETHPFIRPFDDDQPTITVVKPYEEIGPFGKVHNYLWRVQDIINSVISAGFTLRHIEEFHPQIDDHDDWWHKSSFKTEKEYHNKFDWKQNPYAALPQWIGVCASK